MFNITFVIMYIFGFTKFSYCKTKYIWFLFNRLTFVYKHTDYCVRSFYTFTRTFFVRGAVSAASVLVVLMFASSMNTGVLVGYGEFVYG